MPFTVLYPIPSLNVGGAEQQLLELVKGLDRERFHPIVASFTGGGKLEGEFRAVPGVEVVTVPRRGKIDLLPVWQLAALMRSRNVDLVHPMLSPATSLGMLAAILAGTRARVQSERAGRRLEMNFYLRLQDMLTRFAQVVVTNSEAGRDSLVERGVPCGKIVVIENGINLSRLRPDPVAVARYRNRLAVPAGGQVVGILASLIPLKRHDTLLRAAALLKDRREDLRIAIFGDGVLRSDLEALAVDLGVADRVTFFGNQRNVADCLAACTVLVSLSTMEGLSNSILEAMALSVPTIGTDIAGTRELIQHGRTGSLIPVGDDRALARELMYLFEHPEEARQRAERAKAMIDSRFNVQRMVARHESLYMSLLQAAQHVPETAGT